MDICAIEGTYIQNYTTEESLKVVTPKGYAISSKLCLDGNKSSGTLLVCNKETVTLSDTSCFEYKAAKCSECSCFKVGIDYIHLNLFILYHNPEGNVLAFLEDLSNVLERIVISSTELLILVTSTSRQIYRIQ